MTRVIVGFANYVINGLQFIGLEGTFFEFNAAYAKVLEKNYY